MTRSIRLVITILALCIGGGASAQGFRPQHPAFADTLAEFSSGPSVSRIGAISDYLLSLAGTSVDTPVYFLEPAKSSGEEKLDTEPSESASELGLMPTVLILAGAHGDEIAGVLSAYLFIKHAMPQGLRLIVIPRANASAAGVADADRPGPERVSIQAPDGERSVRYGSRYTNPADEPSPDPVLFFPSGAGPDGALDGVEARNLNRAYPGDENGSLTARLAFAIMRLIRNEHVSVAFDLHEAGPDYGLAWDIVAHPKNIEYAASALMESESLGSRMTLDYSLAAYRGFSHWEWGARTGAAAYLIETLNPGQIAGGAPMLDQISNSTSPMWLRAGTHIEAMLAIVHQHALLDWNESSIGIVGMPLIDDLRKDFAAYF